MREGITSLEMLLNYLKKRKKNCINFLTIAFLCKIWMESDLVMFHELHPLHFINHVQQDLVQLLTQKTISGLSDIYIFES